MAVSPRGVPEAGAACSRQALAAPADLRCGAQALADKLPEPSEHAAAVPGSATCRTPAFLAITVSFPPVLEQGQHGPAGGTAETWEERTVTSRATTPQVPGGRRHGISWMRLS